MVHDGYQTHDDRITLITRPHHPLKTGTEDSNLHLLLGMVFETGHENPLMPEKLSKTDHENLSAGK
jgi:hypothetical protein